MSRSALAGPPYVTDDPVPTGEGRWEIYHFISGTHAQSATEGELGLDANYGAGKDLQLTAVFPIGFAHADRTTWTGGDLEFAAKWRLVREQGDRPWPDVAFFPRIVVPTSGPEPRHPSLFLPVWAGRTLGSWYVFGGGGYWINPGGNRRDSVQSGIAITHALGTRGSLGIEYVGRSADRADGRSYSGVNLGLTLAVTRRWTLMASAGPGLLHARSEGQYNFYLSLQYAN